MQSALTRIWTQVADSILYDNHEGLYTLKK